MLPYVNNYNRIFVFVRCKIVEVQTGLLAILNLSTLCSSQRHAVLLVDKFKNKISHSSKLHSVRVRRLRLLRQLYIPFIVNHNFFISPSAKSVSAANVF